jgi:copper(I)-binding protein
MGKWLIGLLMGVVALGGVYFLWKQQQSGASTASNAVEVAELPPPAPAPSEMAAATPPDTAPSTPASAEGIIAVDDPWAKSAGPGKAECYMLFTNTGQTPDRIAAVSSPDADQAVIQDVSGTARGAVHADLDPGVPLVFEPGSLNVTLTGLKHPLKTGDAVTLVFTFAHAGTLTVKVPVGEQPSLSDGIQP